MNRFYPPGLGNAPQGDPALLDLARQFQRHQIGRPNIVMDSIELAAGTRDTLVLKLNTGADMIVEMIVATVDDQPLYALATCPIDLEAIRWTNEATKAMETITSGSGNLLVALSANGAASGLFLGAAARVRRGSEVAFDLTNTDGDDAHDVDIALHGYLTED